jgi:hypothetical protein
MQKLITTVSCMPEDDLKKGKKNVALTSTLINQLLIL